MPVKGIAATKRAFKAKVIHISGPVTRKGVYNILDHGAALADNMTPIDTNNLINSRYKPQLSESGGKVSGTVGYTAEYAAAVHGKPGTMKGEERANGNGEYWDPNAEPEFLKKGFDEVKPMIPAILKAAHG